MSKRKQSLYERVVEPLYTRTVPCITSKSGETYYLLADQMIERCSGAFWFAFRSQFKGMKIGDQYTAYYACVSAEYDGNISLRSVDVRANIIRMAVPSILRVGDVVIGCQHFTGKNAQALRKWIRGAK